MRTRKFPTLIALIVAFATITAGGALAGDSSETTWDLVVADTTLTDTRLITSAAVTPSTTNLTAALAVEVTETAATGVDPWTVSAAVTDFTEWDTVNNVAVSGGASIGRENVTLTPAASIGVTDLISGVAGVAGSAGSYTAGGTDAVELFRVTGEAADTAYTNVWTSTGTFDVDVSGIPSLSTGTYRSTVTVTLAP